MGALDDAIREHIELKRRHGASEDDLRVQEQEALGPARRESPPPAPEEPEQVEGRDADAPEEAFEDRRTTVMPALVHEEHEDDQTAGPGGDLPEPEVFHEAPASVEAGDLDEDMLEETPEFLQETPEHDRLWFEQKPPRDFDFDDK